MSAVPVRRVISTVSVLVGFLALLVLCAYVVRRSDTTAGLRDVAVAVRAYRGALTLRAKPLCGEGLRTAVPQGFHLEQLLEGLQDVAHSGRCDTCPTVGDRRRLDALNAAGQWGEILALGIFGPSLHGRPSLSVCSGVALEHRTGCCQMD